MTRPFSLLENSSFLKYLYESLTIFIDVPRAIKLDNVCGLEKLSLEYGVNLVVVEHARQEPRNFDLARFIVVRNLYKFVCVVAVFAYKTVNTFAAKPLSELVFEEVAAAALSLYGFLIFPSASRTASKLFAYWIVWVKPFIVNFFLATFENVAAF